MRKTTPNDKKGYILRLRQSRTFRGISMTLALSLIFEMIQPSVSMALTEGPSQPEVQSFEPVGTTQMVDLFTGDFNYNIPLFNLPGPNGGYPVNLAYHAGVSMDDEASWVGLGWNLNVGALVRNMRGLPDEFMSEVYNFDGATNGVDHKKGDWKSGDYIRTKTDMKASWTLGASFGKKAETFGGDLTSFSPELSTSVYYNNYKGLGASVGMTFGLGSSPLNFGLSLDSDNGLGLSANVELSPRNHKVRSDFQLGLSFNGSASLSMGMSRKNGVPGRFKHNRDSYRGSRIGSSISFARNNFVPSIGNKVNSFNVSFNFSKASSYPGTYLGKDYGVFFNSQDYSNLDKSGRLRPVMGYSENKSISIGPLNLIDIDRYYTKDFVRQNDGQITKETPVLPNSYYSHDAYTSSGQGLNGYFRGRRNDIGRVHDPKLRNVNFGVNASLEISTEVTPTGNSVSVGPFPPVMPVAILVPESSTTQHFGGGGSVSIGWDDQRPWDRKNELNFDFNDPSPKGIDENHYYQAHGEQTIFDPADLSYMNGTDLALVTFEPKNTNVFTGGKRKVRTADNPHLQSERDAADGRVVRNTLIHNLKNQEVSKLGEFAVPHYSFSSSLDLSQSPSGDLERNTRMSGSTSVGINNHNAGFKVLNEDGSYYVYGLPAYNNKEVENLFSVETPNNHNDANTVSIGSTVNNEVDYKKQGTHKFINKTEKSPYAHSYMLSSVQGADYVDIDNNGPSDEDLGYWVKFDYVKYGDNIKWRAPYHGANYSQGQTYTGQDDKGSYQYGEKEQWYLGRMETKSHIAIFEMSERNDMMEAAGEFVDTGMGAKSGLKIDKIKIYEKSAFNTNGNSATPLQVVNFEYDYSLCKQVLNNNGGLNNPAGNVDSNDGGKLTLKRVYFTSLNSSRGELSPYEFDYTSVDIHPDYADDLDGTNGLNLVNPNYQQNAYDPWGGYRPYATFANNVSNGTYDGGYQQHANFPYVAQTSQGWMQQWSSLYPNSEETSANKELTQQANDLIASTWSLKEIKLPSGGKINIEYESDDYSHVQHKVANQMFKIVKMGNHTSHANMLYNDGVESNQYNDDSSLGDEIARRIYFKLEEPLKTGENGGVYADKIYEKYVEPITEDEGGKRNLYFKSRIRLTQGQSVTGGLAETYEYVRGYLPLEKDISKNLNGSINHNYGVLTTGMQGVTDTQFTDANGDDYYTIGYVTIEPAQRKNGDFFNQYHPMALAAWTYMQTNAQELLNPSSNFNSVGPPSTTGEVLGLFTNILNAVPATAASFGAIRPYCKGKNFARLIDLSNSGIRLASPDRKKYGGGHRVKQITITDEWALDNPDGNTGSTEDSRTYGQVYDYTTKEDGMSMSSGVAQYEPQAGGDENALKYPIHFYGKNKMFTNNNLFAEAPMNEALFPGAMVGYRKVTVRSLNTSDQMKKHVDSNSPEGRTGGITEHEFYTSKEFPTMVEWSTLSEDNHTKDVFNLPIPIPFIGSIKRNYYHGSQAFKIELNDMHGKPKSVKSYELNGYERNNAPITEAVYEYQSKPIVYQGEQVRQLVSEVKTIPKNSAQNLDETNWSNRVMGVETDLFTDQRENKSLSTSVGLNFNADILNVGFIPSFWPSFSNHKTMLRTYVTNKVVHRSGILVRTKTRDLQTVNETEILAYDEKAGTPLVSKVKNEFGDNFYSYNIPAYYHFDRMGHAYQNINYTFDAYVDAFNPNTEGNAKGYVNLDVTPTTSDVFEHLVRGDELLVIDDGISNAGNLHVKAYFLGWTFNSSGDKIKAKIQLLGSSATDGTQTFTFKVIRSGRRNHYGSMAANYLTKGEIAYNANPITLSGSNGSPDFVETSVIDKHVLSATASLFKDDWTSTGGDANLNLDGTTDNPFLSGNSGIFRPYKSYTYVGSRSGAASMDDNTSSGTDPKLYSDGVMSSVPMFSWDLGNIEDYVQNWEWVNEVTRFSQDAYEVENVNRLGIYSSALYGYDNSLTIAVGGNASTYELGAFDFELSSNANTLSQTNMDFRLNQTGDDVLTTEQFNILNATMGAGNVLTIRTDIPASGFNVSNYENNVGLSLITEKGATPKTNEGFFFNGDTGGASSTYTSGSNTYVQFTVSPFIEAGGTSDFLMPDGTISHGKITLMSLKPNATLTVNAEFSSDKAHTGKKSLKVTGGTLFDQPQLKMIKDKKYVVSVWMSSNKKKRTYENDALVEIGTMQGGSYTPLTSNTEITEIKTTYSKVIEGWQKVDFEFEAKVSNATLVLNFDKATGETTYIDDVRFSPRTGGITTYVYDPNRFWLRASLNVDNYATFFYYDEEGNLTIKKQETEEGIFTITESRGHVSE